MSKRLALVWALALAVGPAFGDEGKPARVYTNEDLDRVAPRRGDTGVLSRPETPAARRAADREPSERDAVSPRGEGYWRREATRVRAQVRTLQDQASRLREQVERDQNRMSTATAKNRKGRARESWAVEDGRARRLRELEARARELQSDLEDRARRDGAPPGWLR